MSIFEMFKFNFLKKVKLTNDKPSTMNNPLVKKTVFELIVEFTNDLLSINGAISIKKNIAIPRNHKKAFLLSILAFISLIYFTKIISFFIF